MNTRLSNPNAAKISQTKKYSKKIGLLEMPYIEYTLGDGRKVKINFTADGNKTKVTESFEAENTNSIEMQRGGWQAILDNFKKYTEASL